MNFYDYLTWRGDLTFDRDQFNIVDNLLFAYSAYTDLREVITTDEPITVHEAAERFFKLHTEEECLKSGSLIAHAPVVLRRMGESKRFGDLLITDLSKLVVPNSGNTIIGWKEDFQLSYRKVNAQLKAAEYLNRTADKSFHKYFVGGHSKGGNLAVYGAMEAKDSVKKKIIRIYSNDGPGISSIAMNEKEFKKIGNRMIKVLPELSVFGMLFDNHEPKIVVKSDKNFLYEHDAVGWMVSGTDFVRGTLSPDCLVIQDVLNEFLEAMTLEERAELVDQMYSAFVNAGIENTTDFTQKGLSAVMKFLKEVTHLNENAGKSMEKLLQILGKMLTERAEGAVKSTVKNVTDALPDFLKQPLNRNSKAEEEKDEKE